MRKKILSFISLLSLCFIALLSACTSSKSDNGNNNSSKETENSEHTHTYSTSYTYDDKGHWHKSTCEHDLKKDYSSHIYTEWKVTKEATETSNGEKMRTCSVCGYSQSETIDKLEHVHTYSTDFEYNESTHWHASTCEHNLKSDVSSHEFSEWTIMKNPTVSSSGEKSRTCTVCGYIQTETIAPLDGYSTTWKDYDGTVLKIEYSDTLLPSSAYTETLTRESDQVYNYTFAGFEQEIISAKEIEYIAKYTKSYVLYTVTFLNFDDSVILSKKYHYGEEVTKPSTPKREDSKEFNYTFVGWDKTISLVTGDATYKALYSYTKASYEVTWKNEDGTILKTETLEYGTTPTAPSNPTKTSNETYTYTFAGWTPEVNAVTGNVIYTATYSQTLNKYNITFVSNGGTEIGTKELECTTLIDIKPEYENKTFIGWYDSNDIEVTNVPTKDTTLYAKWIDYDINFSYNAITYISTNDTLDKEHFSIVATDTDGDNLDVDISIINGKFEGGMTITVRIVVIGKYDNKISKTISGIKVYSNPSITYSLDKDEVNLSEVNLNLFNTSAQDSFGNSLTVNYKPYNDTLSGGKNLSFVLYTTDITGNYVEVITNPIKVYSIDDISLNYSVTTKNIKVTSIGEEFNATATNSFNETLDIKLVADSGYTIKAGNIVNLYITATDKLGNVKKSELIENVKIYGPINIKYTGTTEYLTPNDNIYNLYEVKDSFDELYYDLNIISGGLDQNEIEFNIKAKDKANNTLDETYHFYFLEDNESLVYMYENNELVGKTVIKNGENYSLNKKYDNVGATWYLDNVQITDDSANSLDVWNNSEKICSVYIYIIINLILI